MSALVVIALLSGPFVRVGLLYGSGNSAFELPCAEAISLFFFP